MTCLMALPPSLIPEIEVLIKTRPLSFSFYKISPDGIFVKSRSNARNLQAL